LADTVEISVRLRCFLRRLPRRRWSAGCPSLNVYSQGSSKEDAKRCLREAIELWLESCLERGTLDEALRESGFRIADWSEPASANGDEIAISSLAEDEGVLGDSFPLDITIPAYQAALLTSLETR
jgi:hypothetical protein